MPGFTAELSLNKTSRYYQTTAIGIADVTRVVPQARVASCILTIDGGSGVASRVQKDPFAGRSRHRQSSGYDLRIDAPSSMKPRRFRCEKEL